MPVSNLWKVKVNGGSVVTLASLNVRSPVVFRPSMDVGSLTFTVPCNDVTEARPFTYGHEVILYRDTTPWFVGRVRKCAFTLVTGEMYWSVAIYDSWWEMERTVYRQPIVVTKSDFSGLVGYMSGRVVLNQDAWGRQISQGLQLTNAVYYAQGQNPGKISLGAVPTIAQAWNREETREITVAEAVRRCSALAPSAFAVREYGSEIFSMSWVARGSLTLTEIDLDDKNLVKEIRDLDKRLDVIPPGVVFDFFVTTVDGDGKSKVTLQRQFAGTPGGPNTVYASFNLGACDSPPSGAATSYYNALATAQWTGQLRCVEIADCSGVTHPGCRLRIANGQTDWATMDAVVKAVTEDLELHATTIDLGPPDILGMDDFVDVLNRFRNRPAPTGWCKNNNNGTEGAPEGKDDEDEDTTPPGDTGEGDRDGVDGGATDNAPAAEGEGSPPTPEPNPDAGTPPPFGPVIDLQYCKDGVPRTARVVGIDIGEV